MEGTEARSPSSFWAARPSPSFPPLCRVPAQLVVFVIPILSAHDPIKHGQATGQGPQSRGEGPAFVPTLCLLGKGLMLQPGVKRGGYWLGIQWHRHPQLSCPGGRTSGILRKGCWGLLRGAYGASSSLIFIF